MSVPPPRLGDRYEIGELIGRGGMADVHRAHDTVLDRSVAVKVLRDVTPTDTQRFADEARLLSTLNDANIVAILDAGVTDEPPWLALELVDGTTLRDLMAQGPLDPATAQGIGRDVAAALAHAHERGIVHRDVKPSNVVLTDDGSAKLTDFGIARLDDSSAGVTLTGHTVGTAAYLSPEQVRGDDVTGSADVYALGLVLLEALTAVRAYPGPVTEAALARLHHSPLIPTSLPAGWTGLIAAMTAATASERPSAAEVARQLDVEDFPASSGAFPPTVLARHDRSTSGPRRRRTRRLRAVPVAAALALVASLTLARGLTGGSTAEADTEAAPPSRSALASSVSSESGTAHTTRVTPEAPATSAAVVVESNATGSSTRIRSGKPASGSATKPKPKPKRTGHAGGPPHHQSHHAGHPPKPGHSPKANHPPKAGHGPSPKGKPHPPKAHHQPSHAKAGKGKAKAPGHHP